MPFGRFNSNLREVPERLQQVTGVRPFLQGPPGRKMDKLRGMREEEGCCGGCTARSAPCSSHCHSPTAPGPAAAPGMTGPGCNSKLRAALRSPRRGRPVPQRGAGTRLTPEPSPLSLPPLPSARNGSAPPRRLSTAPGAGHSQGRGALRPAVAESPGPPGPKAALRVGPGPRGGGSG